MSNDVEQGKPGQLFEDFLKEQGTHEATSEQALKRVLAYQLQRAMEDQHITKAAMAKRLDTSRSQLDRLLDPDNHTGVSIGMLARAAQVVGRTLKIDLV